MTSTPRRRLAGIARPSVAVADTVLALLLAVTLSMELNCVREYAQSIPESVQHSATAWTFAAGGIVSTAHIALTLLLRPTHRRRRLAAVAATVSAVWTAFALTAGAFLDPMPTCILLGGGCAALILAAAARTPFLRRRR